MGNVVKTYPSKSKPGKEYHVIKASDGTFYCDCWQWKRNRTCSHLENYLKGRILHGTGYTMPNTETKKGSVEDKIDNVINNFFPR